MLFRKDHGLKYRLHLKMRCRQNEKAEHKMRISMKKLSERNAIFIDTSFDCSHTKLYKSQSVNVGTTHKDEVLSIFFILHWNLEIYC